MAEDRGLTVSSDIYMEGTDITIHDINNHLLNIATNNGNVYLTPPVTVYIWEEAFHKLVNKVMNYHPEKESHLENNQILLSLVIGPVNVIGNNPEWMDCPLYKILIKDVT